MDDAIRERSVGFLNEAEDWAKLYCQTFLELS
jgi:hypothetical protein